MPYQKIDTTTDHGTYRGDPGKTAFEKANGNFEELYQLFQTAANKLGYFDAAGKPAFTDLTAFARTLLDDPDAGAIRSTLGLGSAALAPVNGTVSQSGGTATGALFESGKNGNGEYVRFANGTQICRRDVGSQFAMQSQSGGIWYSSNSGRLPFPAAFIEPPTVVAAPRAASGHMGWVGYDSSVDANYSPNFYLVSPGQAYVAYFGYMAFGRWF